MVPLIQEVLGQHLFNSAYNVSTQGNVKFEDPSGITAVTAELFPLTIFAGTGVRKVLLHIIN